MQYTVVFLDEHSKPICAYNCNKLDEKSMRFTRVQKTADEFTFSQLFSIRKLKPHERKEIFTALNLFQPTTSKPTDPTSNQPCVNQPIPEIMDPPQHDSSLESIRSLIIDESSKMTTRSKTNNSKPTNSKPTNSKPTKEKELLRRKARGKQVDYELLVDHKRGEYVPTWSKPKPKSDTEFRDYCKTILE